MELLVAGISDTSINQRHLMGTGNAAGKFGVWITPLGAVRRSPHETSAVVEASIKARHQRGMRVMLLDTVSLIFEKFPCNNSSGYGV